MAKGWALLLILVLLPVLLLPGGCTRGRSQDPAGPQKPPAAAPASGGPAAADRGAAAPAPGGEAAAEPKEPAERKPRQTITLEKVESGRPAAHAVSEQTSLAVLDRDGRIMPEDFRIGPLQDTLQASREQLAVTRVVEGFLRELSRSKIDPQYLDPLVREELLRSLIWYVEQDFVPERYRIGRIDREGGAEARVGVRLFRGEGSAEGELYLAETGGTWYISDVQVGLEVLAEPRPQPAEKFVPAAPGSAPAP